MAAPFAGATMTGLGGAAATSSASLFTAAAVSAPIAATTASMMMSPGIISAGSSGGLLAGIGTAADAINKYSSIISTGFSGLQAVNAYQRGQFLEQKYKMQAEQVRTEQEIKRLNLLQAANDKTRNILATNASNVASGFASGVSGFDGSIKLVTKKNEERYLRDISALEFNSTSSELFQDAQMSLLATAGDEAVRGSKYDALRHIGNAYNIYNQTRVPT